MFNKRTETIMQPPTGHRALSDASEGIGNNQLRNGPEAAPESDFTNHLTGRVHSRSRLAESKRCSRVRPPVNLQRCSHQSPTTATGRH